MDSTTAEKVGIRAKLARELIAYFLYLSSFFILLRFYTNLMLAEYDIDYMRYGLCVLKSLVLAKIILLGESLRLGRRFGETPLIVQTFYKAALFSAFALVFEVLEHLILGGGRGKAPAEVMAELLDKGWPHLAAMTLIVFVGFLPFFAFRETARGLGDGKLEALFFKRGAPVDSRAWNPQSLKR